MSGFFGCVSRLECVNEVFYGTDYHSHLGTKRAGMAFYDGEKFVRSIHSLENGYFRNKFEDDLPRFGESKMGIGVISDNESQPITITSHLGRYAVVTVARIDNIEELTQMLLEKRKLTDWYFSEENSEVLLQYVAELQRKLSAFFEVGPTSQIVRNHLRLITTIQLGSNPKTNLHNQFPQQVFRFIIYSTNRKFRLVKHSCT